MIHQQYVLVYKEVLVSCFRLSKHYSHIGMDELVYCQVLGKTSATEDSIQSEFCQMHCCLSISCCHSFVLTADFYFCFLFNIMVFLQEEFSTSR